MTWSRLLSPVSSHAVVFSRTAPSAEVQQTRRTEVSYSSPATWTSAFERSTHRVMTILSV